MRLKRLEVGSVGSGHIRTTAQRHGGDQTIRQRAGSTASPVEQFRTFAGIRGLEFVNCWKERLRLDSILRGERAAQEFDHATTERPSGSPPWSHPRSFVSS